MLCREEISVVKRGIECCIDSNLVLYREELSVVRQKFKAV